MKRTPLEDLPLWDRDEDLLSAVEPDGRGRCRVRRWSDVEVVLGRGGRASVEVNLEAAAREGVPVLRRRGGGCAVVLDPGNLVVSAAVPWPGVGEVTRAFRTFTDWICDGVAAIGGPRLVGDGVSDLVLDDRKVGGSCIYRTRGLVYYSTTLLVSPDLDRIDRLLPHPPREPEYRRGRDHRAFLVTVPTPDIEAFASNLSAKLTDSLPGT